MRVKSPYRGLALLTVLTLSSCSLLYDLSPDQCGSNSDCAKFGSAFRCEEGLCKGPATAGNANGGGSSGGSHAGGSSGTGGSVVAQGGANMGGSPMSEGGAAGAEGGSGGAPFVPECETNNDCFDLHGDVDPWACVDGICQPLKTDECPVVLPLKDTSYNNLKSSNAIILGAFSTIPSTSLVGPITRNFDLAVTEFMDKAGGLPFSGKRRQVVMVVCNRAYTTEDDLLVPAQHLVNDLKVPGIIGTLPASAQQYVFEQVGLPNGVFFMMPTYSDESLINYQDDGLVWHMLSGADSLWVSYQPLLDLTIEHLRNQSSLGAADDARVALITATDERFLSDLGGELQKNLVFNGQNAIDNAPDKFRSIDTTSVYTDPDSDQGDVVNQMLEFKPHVIVASTADETFQKIIPLLESRWSSEVPDQDPPFYLLSPFVFNIRDISSLLDAQPSVRTRMIGINWPAAEDRSVYNAYQLRYDSAYPGTNDHDYENFYDAAYYLIYGVAAGAPLIGGSRIAEGMLDITQGTQSYEVGKDDMPAAFSALSANIKFKLIGAGGPPNWDNAGGRHDAGSVWCVDSDVNHTYLADVMRYDDASKLLTGTLPCFTFP